MDSSDFTFVVLTTSDAELDKLHITLTDPTKTVVKPTTVADGPFGLGGHTYPSRAFYFGNVQHGNWDVDVGLSPSSDRDAITAFTFVTFADGDSPVSVTVSADSVQNLLGNTVELKADVVEQIASVSGNVTRLRNKNVESVDLIIRHPSGKVWSCTTTLQCFLMPAKSPPVLTLRVKTQWLVNGFHLCLVFCLESRGFTVVSAKDVLAATVVISSQFVPVWPGPKYFHTILDSQPVCDFLGIPCNLMQIPSSIPPVMCCDVFSGQR